MKRAFSLMLVLAGLVAFSSCETCATCTSTDSVTGEAITDEFCGSGNDYKDQLERYEDNNWSCSED